MRARTVTADVLIGLRRNLTMTFAVIGTVAISLSLLGAGLLLHDQVNAMKDYWFDKVEVSVFLCPTRADALASGQPLSAGPAAAGTSAASSAAADPGTPSSSDGSTAGSCPTPLTDAQLTALRASLHADPQIATVYYESTAQAYQHFRQQFAGSPDLIANVSPQALPASFRLKLHDPAQVAAVAARYSGAAGVAQVNDPRRVLAAFFRLLHAVQTAALVLAGVQLAAAVLLISNTMRISAFTRRRETAVMRLVGATDLYIQLPFLLEGALAGLAGALVACGVITGVKALIIDQALAHSFALVTFVGWGSVAAMVPQLLVLGTVLAGVASAVALQRHLRT